jgi:4-hydroxybenzoate polyprenyltransferase
LAFLAIAQIVAYYFLFRQEGGWMPDFQLLAVLLATGGIVGGGTLINSFYDLDRDLVQRPWRTLFERPVAKKYGLRIAAWLYAIGLLSALVGLPFPANAGFGLYAILVWLYSHKQWGQHRLGPLMATLLAYTPLLLLAFTFAPHSARGFWTSLPLALVMIAIEWRRQWERKYLLTLPVVERKALLTRQWIYKGLLILGVLAIPLTQIL